VALNALPEHDNLRFATSFESGLQGMNSFYDVDDREIRPVQPPKQLRKVPDP
jgi:hypothetical protein